MDASLKQDMLALYNVQDFQSLYRFSKLQYVISCENTDNKLSLLYVVQLLYKDRSLRTLRSSSRVSLHCLNYIIENSNVYIYVGAFLLVLFERIYTVTVRFDSICVYLLD